MGSFPISKIEDFLIRAAGKITLGVATPATFHCIEIATAEIARRDAGNAGRDACDQTNLRYAKILAARVSEIATAAA
jgi:hypothetical protein